MTLARAGIKRRINPDSLTAQGDEAGHTLERSKPYREYLNSLNWTPPDENSVVANSPKAKIISDFLVWGENNNVKVIGGLPTTFNDQPVPDTLVAKLSAFYKSKNQVFLSMANKSQYPRSHFFDTPYHLSEEYQIKHSVSIAEMIKAHFYQPAD